jgi:ribonuclease HII
MLAHRSKLRAAPDFSLEMPCWQRGLQLVAGVDEAGRGALAGPVAAGALILPPKASLVEQLDGVRDSKQMTPRGRELWATRIKELATAWSVGYSTAEEIDALGILPATRLAIQRAIDLLPTPPQHLLVDYFPTLDCGIPHQSLVKGDRRSLSIAGASILAKTARDAAMRHFDDLYPGYGFVSHKGYGTAAHRRALARLGPCAIHRRSFRFAP